MAIIQNNISFTNVNNIGKGTSISNIKKGSVDDMIADASELSSEEFANDYGAIQSLNINWNGAELSYLPAQGTQIVNTTGDFC